MAELASFYDDLRHHSILVNSEFKMLKVFRAYQLKSNGQPSEVEALDTLLHERIHELAALKLEIRGAIRMQTPIKASFYTAYFEMNIDDLQRISRSKAGTILNILGQVTIAPFIEDWHQRKRLDANNLREARLGMRFFEQAQKRGMAPAYDLIASKEAIEMQTPIFMGRRQI